MGQRRAFSTQKRTYLKLVCKKHVVSDHHLSKRFLGAAFILLCFFLRPKDVLLFRAWFCSESHQIRSPFGVERQQSDDWSTEGAGEDLDGEPFHLGYPPLAAHCYLVEKTNWTRRVTGLW